MYTRAGKELAYFRAHGYTTLVLPGLSSALAARACAGIQVTDRGIAQSFVVFIGIGRQGTAVSFPGHDCTCIALVLVGVARLSKVVMRTLATASGDSAVAPLTRRIFRSRSLDMAQCQSRGYS